MYERIEQSNEKNLDHSRCSERRLHCSLARCLSISVLATIFFVGAPILALAATGPVCKNEDLRSAFGQLLLPDCRAYEMVSPQYKEGYPIFVAEHSISSEKAILTSLGSLDASGDSESPLRGVLYLDMRTPSGWKISALNAPSSEFVGEFPTAAEPVSGETLWEQHRPQESSTKLGLYARSINANPAFRFIGPLNIPFEGEPTEPTTTSTLNASFLTKSVGATKNYDHVIVVGDGNHWAFDTTPFKRPSLYEYSGTNNTEPILVGVKGEKGSTELISLCGVLPGSESSTYNALSSDGEAIFFTVLSKCGAGSPESEEVYARLNGALTDPGPAKTVDVSTSQCTVGGSECTDESGKNFEGASENGQRVFFTSTQKLTNDAVDSTASGNAAEIGEVGGCARAKDCNLYEYRFNLSEGANTHLTSGALHLVSGGGVLGVAGIAEDGSRIYFVSHDEIMSAGTNEFGKRPEGGEPNLYVYDTVTERTAFIATLKEADEEDWQKGFSGRITEVGGESGQYLLFESTTHLTPDDIGKMRQLFEYDAESNELVRVTKGEDGYNEDGNGVSVGVPINLMVTAGLQLGGGIDFKSSVDRLNISDDGRTVVFETGGRLSPRATSAEARAPLGPCRSLYEFHSPGALSEGAVHLISDGRETQIINGRSCGAEFQGMDASGEDIMFESIDSLLPSDVDGGQRDLYDARAGGGFAISEEEQQERCVNTCESISSTNPVFDIPTSIGGSPEAPLPGKAKMTSKKVPSRKTHKPNGKDSKRHRKRKASRSSGVSGHRKRG